ncbi:MAG: response regulator [Chloroflexi bacterium]|nr:response regulator [Chloroflexota bacterium]
MNWLIAEDEADIRNLVSMMCRAWGHTPLAFESGQKAWDFLDTVEAGTYSGPLPEFALMDIRMPGKKGNEVANRIRRVQALAHIPVVLMTAFTLTDDERAAMMRSDGVDQIISKPLPDFEKLHGILHDIIREKSGGH